MIGPGPWTDSAQWTLILQAARVRWVVLLLAVPVSPCFMFGHITWLLGSSELLS